MSRFGSLFIAVCLVTILLIVAILCLAAILLSDVEYSSETITFYVGAIVILTIIDIAIFMSLNQELKENG